MRTALDTNILSPIWTREPNAEIIADQLLRVRLQGTLVVSGTVFVELSAVPGLSVEIAEKTLRNGSVEIDFDLGEDSGDSRPAVFPLTQVVAESPEAGRPNDC